MSSSFVIPRPALDYIKRVVGLPGDEVAYLNKQLAINGKPVETRSDGEYYDDERLYYKQQVTRSSARSSTASWSTSAGPRDLPRDRPLPLP